MKKLGFLITLLSLISGVITVLYKTFADIGIATELLEGEPLAPIGGAVIIVVLLLIVVSLIVLLVLMLFYRKGFFVPLLFIIGFGWLGLQLSAAGYMEQYFAFGIVAGSALSFLGSFFGKKPKEA